VKVVTTGTTIRETKDGT